MTADVDIMEVNTHCGAAATVALDVGTAQDWGFTTFSCDAHAEAMNEYLGYCENRSAWDNDEQAEPGYECLWEPGYAERTVEAQRTQTWPVCEWCGKRADPDATPFVRNADRYGHPQIGACCWNVVVATITAAMNEDVAAVAPTMGADGASLRASG